MLKKYNITLYNMLFMIAAVAAIYYNGINDEIAKYISMGIFAILFVCAIIRCAKVGVLPIFKKWTMWIFLYALINFFYGFESDKIVPTEQAMPLIIAFSSTYLFTLDLKQFKFWFIPISIFLSYVAFLSVIGGMGTLTVNENSGGVEVAKNQIGPCFVVVAIVSYVYLIQQDTMIWERVVFGITTIFNVIPSLYLGCRTALLCFFLVTVFLTYRVYKLKGTIIIVIISFLVVLLFGKEYLYDIFYRSIVGDRDANDIPNLTSGRDIGIIISWEYFLEHPLNGYFGSGNPHDYYSNPHVYLLFHLTKWGIIGSIPAIALYISICKLFIDSLIKNNAIIFSILFVAIIESFAEYSPPFGPGSCFTMVYLLLGIYLRENFINN